MVRYKEWTENDWQRWLTEKARERLKSELSERPSESLENYWMGLSPSAITWSQKANRETTTTKPLQSYVT